MSDQVAKKISKPPAVLYPGYVAIWLYLLACTALTLLTSLFDLGRGNILVAMGIATTKASLVLLFFMHLKEEAPLFRGIFLVAVCILAIFIGLTFFDVAFR